MDFAACSRVALTAFLFPIPGRMLPEALERSVGVPETLVRLDMWGPVMAPIDSSRPPPEDGLWFGRRSKMVPSVLTAGFGCNLSGAGP